jgi:Flp pilus assembly protein CpaB
MATTADNRFIHSKPARLIALLVAALIALLFFSLWGKTVEQLIAGQPAQEVIIAGQDLKKDNPALTECLATRVGHVDTLKSEGTINDKQYASFKERAEALCNSQNPS